MGAIACGLSVAGHFFPVLRCDYGAQQATDGRGRVVTRVRFSPVELLLDVPATDFLLVWAAHPTQRYPVTLTWHDAHAAQTLETLTMAGAYCVGYQEAFTAGDQATGAYRCHLTLADPGGWQLTAGGPPAGAQARVPPGFGSPLLTPPATPPPPLEVPPVGPGLLVRLLAVLPELSLATLVALFVPANDADAPGYQSEKDFFKRLHHIPLTDKDQAELADLEQRHAAGTLTEYEQRHLLSLLARVKGLHLDKLAQLRTLPSRLPDSKALPRGRVTTIQFNDRPDNQQAIRRENESALLLAQAGYDVEQNPSVSGTKKPDYRIEGNVFDCYAPTTDKPRAIWTAVEAKVKREQTQRVIINLNDAPVNIQALSTQFNQYPIPNLQEVILIKEDRISHLLP